MEVGEGGISAMSSDGLRGGDRKEARNHEKSQAQGRREGREGDLPSSSSLPPVSVDGDS